jgi:hypothetical protein
MYMFVSFGCSRTSINNKIHALRHVLKSQVECQICCLFRATQFVFLLLEKHMYLFLHENLQKILAIVRKTSIQKFRIFFQFCFYIFYFTFHPGAYAPRGPTVHSY